MSTADHILDQIDSALHDYSVSDDAMRSTPAATDDAMRSTPAATSERGPDVHMYIADEAGEWQEIPGVTTIEIQINHPAIDPEFQRSWQELREHLARVEAERVRRARAAIEAFGRAYAQAMKPAMEAVAQGIAELQRVAQHVDPPPAPGRRHDRPAWQSPYGPPRRRR